MGQVDLHTDVDPLYSPPRKWARVVEAVSHWWVRNDVHTVTLADSYYLMIYISLLLAPIAYRAVECGIGKDVLGFFSNGTVDYMWSRGFRFTQSHVVRSKKH